MKTGEIAWALWAILALTRITWGRGDAASKIWYCFPGTTCCIQAHKVKNIKCDTTIRLRLQLISFQKGAFLNSWAQIRPLCAASWNYYVCWLWVILTLYFLSKWKLFTIYTNPECKLAGALYWSWIKQKATALEAAKFQSRTHQSEFVTSKNNSWFKRNKIKKKWKLKDIRDQFYLPKKKKKIES